MASEEPGTSSPAGEAPEVPRGDGEVGSALPALSLVIRTRFRGCTRVQYTYKHLLPRAELPSPPTPAPEPAASTPQYLPPNAGRKRGDARPRVPEPHVGVQRSGGTGHVDCLVCDRRGPAISSMPSLRGRTNRGPAASPRLKRARHPPGAWPGENPGPTGTSSPLSPPQMP